MSFSRPVNHAYMFDENMAPGSKKDTETDCDEQFSSARLSLSTLVAVILFLCFFPYKIPENPTNPASPNPSKKAALDCFFLVEVNVE